MPADGRVSAWVLAWRHLDSAQRLLDKDPEHPAIGAFHDALVSRADVYARLASAPEDIGVAAGEFLQQEEIQKREERKRTEKAIEEVLSRG